MVGVPLIGVVLGYSALMMSLVKRCMQYNDHQAVDGHVNKQDIIEGLETYHVSDVHYNRKQTIHALFRHERELCVMLLRRFT